MYIAPRYSTEHTQWALPGEGVVLFWTYPVSAIRRGHRLVLFRTYTVILLKAKSVSALQNIPSERYSERACRSQLSSGQNLSSEAAWYDCVTWPNTQTVEKAKPPVSGLDLVERWQSILFQSNCVQYYFLYIYIFAAWDIILNEPACKCRLYIRGWIQTQQPIRAVSVSDTDTGAVPEPTGIPACVRPTASQKGSHVRIQGSIDFSPLSVSMTIY